MSDLLSLLSLGSAGIAAQGSGVAVAQQNVANVNTAGYSRQRVDLEALARLGGVRADRPDRLEDSLLGARLRTNAGSLAWSRAGADALADLEQRLVAHAPSLEERLGALRARFQQLAATPTDPTLRGAAVDAARELAAGFRDRAGELADARAEANARIRGRVDEASELARRLADANRAVARTGDPVLRDERDLLAQQLAELVGGAARIDPDGQLRFVLDGGAVLVDGTHAATLAATPDPVTFDLAVAVVDGSTRRDVGTTLGGRLGGDLGFRDGALAAARTELDQLAAAVAAQYNAVHTANVALDGSTGRPLFTGTGAADLEVEAAVAADPSLLATRAPGGGPGDNGGALALVAAGPGLANQAIDLVAHLGTAAARARADVRRDELAGEHLAALRDSLAGVDIQEELANLARFQHASAAMTSFVSTIDQMLGDLIDRL